MLTFRLQTRPSVGTRAELTPSGNSEEQYEMESRNKLQKLHDGVQVIKYKEIFSLPKHTKHCFLMVGCDRG